MNKVKQQTGLVLDIDDTLADTAFFVMKKIRHKFGHALQVEELVKKYQQPGNVPEWQTEEISKEIYKIFNDRDFLLTVPAVVGSIAAVSKLNQSFPVQFYLTSRPYTQNIEAVTRSWLEQNDFPPAPVIFRDPSETVANWKVLHLSKQRKGSLVYIDNDASHFACDLSGLDAVLIWLNLYHSTKHLPSKVHRLKDWEEIVAFLKQHTLFP